MHHDPRTLDPQHLEPAPIPDEWVIEGSPRARAAELGRSPDGTCTAAHWDCTAGTFHWFFFNEEIVHILDGEVVVRNAREQERVLRKGDVAVLPANEWMVWRVDRYVRKLAYCRFPVPRPLGKLVRGVQKARAWFGMKQVPSAA
jgi:uncharacterized cupin superfamily protein